jgi:BirA family biotin operon repressor/biotin-[acetyl-CoA-carboxylase] ligase
MINFKIIKLDAIDSTNDWLKEKFLQGNCIEGDLVWVNDQTNGRGQRDNRWISAAGKNLTFSLFKVFGKLLVRDQFLINCSVTLAILMALKEINIPDLSLKWPNDILSGNKKIGGVLIENFVRGERFSGTIVGVGLNVNQDNFDLFPKASSILMLTQKEQHLDELLKRILEKFNDFFEQCKSENKIELINQYQANLYMKDQWVVFENSDSTLKGKIKGINSKGKIKIEKENGTVEYFSGGSLKLLY